MPPLQNWNQSCNYSSYSPDAEQYVTVDDNRILQGKANQDIFSRAPVSRHSSSNEQFMVLSQRDVVIAQYPLNEATGYRNAKPNMSSMSAAVNIGAQYSAPSGVIGSLMDILANLCVCETSNLIPSSRCGVSPQEEVGRPQDEEAEKTQSIVYPVARYPARLNSPEMVQQRRKSLQKHLMFRPVIE